MTRDNTAPFVGMPLVSGGYGCVFKPALNCANPKLTKKNGISKLMQSRYADQEINEINKVKPFIEKIPNNQNYFLVSDINSCEPAPLLKTDKFGFNEKCLNLVPNFNYNNVNDNLDKLKIINIPYGGISIRDYFKKTTNQILAKIDKKKILENFYRTNISMIQLLNNGIIPLNKFNFLHMDVKADNILYKVDGDISSSKYEIYTRLIDWGLSGHYNENKLPQFVINKYIQFNNPFGIVLFEEEINNDFLYNVYVKYRGDSKLVAREIYNRFCRGKGHNIYILDILDKIFKKKYGNKFSYSFSEKIIINNIATILRKYVDDNNYLDKISYFKEVFSKNVDIYGFLMSYWPIIAETISMQNNPFNNPLTNKITNILIEYCFSTKYAANPLPIDEINNRLKALIKKKSISVKKSKTRKSKSQKSRSRRSRRTRYRK